MVEPKLFLELLVRLFTDPSGLDGGCKHHDGGIGRQVRHIVFLLSGRSPLADKPDLVARHALHTIIEHPMLMTVRNPNTASREATAQPALGAPSPADLSPFLSVQRCLGGNRRPVRNVVFAALSSFLRWGR